MSTIFQEVPNPVMPPPRRFSAAPTLTCPHRNKSSSHSSSSLHHTYSIDSSESMITVIPANRPGGNQSDFQLQFKRSSRGSISCQSSQAQSPCNSGQGMAFGSNLGATGQTSTSIGSGDQLERSGSIYNLQPRSPLSPSRCSPIPNTSELDCGSCSITDPKTIKQTNFNANQSNSNQQLAEQSLAQNSGSLAVQGGTVGQHHQRTLRWLTQTESDQQQQPQSTTPLLTSSCGGFEKLSEAAKGSEAQFSKDSPGIATTGSFSNLTVAQQIHKRARGQEEDSSLAAENGTSYNSSRNELDEFGSISSFDDLGTSNAGQSRELATGLLSPRTEYFLGDQTVTTHESAHRNDYQISSASPNKQGDTLMPPTGLHGQHQHQQHQHQGSHRGSTAATTYETDSPIDPNMPMICATINDFCARHSREELLYLVSQVDGLKMSECYYSEKSSTLCMVIEVYSCDSSDIQSADC